MYVSSHDGPIFEIDGINWAQNETNGQLILMAPTIRMIRISDLHHYTDLKDRVKFTSKIES